MPRSIGFTLSLVTVAFLAACSSDKPAPLAPPPPPSAPVVAAPAAAPAPPPVTSTGVYLDPTIASACGIPQPKMYFSFDSAEVKTSDSATVDQLSACLMTGPLKGKTLDIVGRTDPRGNDEHNRKLGQSRADSVAAVLSSRGLGEGMSKTSSTGEEQATGSDETGWANDRRVDIRLAK